MNTRPVDRLESSDMVAALRRTTGIAAPVANPLDDRFLALQSVAALPYPDITPAAPRETADNLLTAAVATEVTTIPTPARVSLVRSMSWSFVGNIVDVMCAWAFLTLLVKLGTVTMVGQYGLAMAMLAPIFAFSSMQMRALQATDARQEFTFGSFLTTRMYTLVIALAALMVLLVINREEHFIVLLTLLVFARLAAISIQDVFLGLLQQHEWINRMAQAQIMSSVSLIAAFAVGLVVTDSLIGGIGASTAVAVVAIFIYCLPAARKLARARSIRAGLAPAWETKAVGRLLATSTPLGVVSFLISLQSNLPRLFLDRYTDTAGLGVFVALGALLAAGVALAASVTQAVVPRLAWLRLEGDKHAFISLLTRLELAALGLLVVAVGGAWLVGPPVVRIIYSAEYARYHMALMWLAASCGITLMNGFVGNAITVARRLKIQVVNNILALVITAALCQVLIPGFGVTGAAAAVALAALLSLALNIVVLTRFLHSWAPNQPATGSAGTLAFQE